VVNRYAAMGFWQFTLITTLVTVFFPWNSLVRGHDDTRSLMLAMAKDWLITVLTVLVIVVVLVVVAVWAVVRYFSG
jgi:tetrahydromethanopterin S-methyltransferase subunit C